MLGCDQTPVSALCTNPGGIGTDRTGTAPLPTGATSGDPVLGTKNGDAAIVEQMTPRRAPTCSRTASAALPLDASTLNDGDVLVTGANANHLVADPTSEASTGCIDRDAINPLQQLKEFSAASRAPSSSLRPMTRPAIRSRRRRCRARTRRTTGNLQQTGRARRRATSARSTSPPRPATASSRRAPTRGRATSTCRRPTRYTFAFQQSRGGRRTRTSRSRSTARPRTLANAADRLRRHDAGHADQRRLHRAAAHQPRVQRGRADDGLPRGHDHVQQRPRPRRRASASATRGRRATSTTPPRRPSARRPRSCSSTTASARRLHDAGSRIIRA